MFPNERINVTKRCVLLQKVVVETTKRLSAGTFKKCDMHIHSSSCYSRDYEKSEFFDALTGGDLDVVAVTDHNSVDVKLLSELQGVLAKENKTLIGGVELNVKLHPDTIKQYNLTLGKGSKGEYFHAIVWFSMEDAGAMAQVVTHLFEKRLLAEKGAPSDGKPAIQPQSPKSFSKMTEGKAIFLEEFQKEAAAIPHFFIPHENKDRSLSSYLPNNCQANLDYKNRLFYYSHAMAVEGGSKSRKSISTGMAEELETTVAALFFSDAKTTEEIGSRFTWIDFDGDLESLLLAISDPESRIKTSDEYPELPQTNTGSFLESVSFNTYVSGAVDNSRPITLNFSPGYNGIVGSRGSGKSMLACLLANKGVDTYSRFVDADSVKFKMQDGVPTSNRPKCLYLGQGELEEIYRSGKYEQIPFLDEHISPLKEKARKGSEEAADELKTWLNLGERLLKAFCTKYPNGPLRINHLDAAVPSGITIEGPSLPARDAPQITKAKNSLNVIDDKLRAASEAIGSIKFNASYPEDNTLFEALEAETRAIQNDMEAVIKRIRRFSDGLGKVDPSWFSRREELVSLFSETLNTANNASGSTTLAQYQKQTKDATAFLYDLLSLRISLKHVDEEAQAAYERMHKPIDPVPLQNGDEPIEISLFYEDDSTYDDKRANLLGASSSKDLQALAEAFLRQADRRRMHKLFDGRKFISYSSRDLGSHYEKYFELAKTTICDAGSLKTQIKIAEKPIDDMSPGTKAQALLKLFLNDSVASGRWAYVVIDQPEDNLDVATIKDFLVDRLKQLKLNVQFFVVSHSAPVIVNGDARTVIVCNNDNNGISYVPGPLNESPIKQSIADVLDGGERYLKMRLNKYNFQVGDHS